MLTRETTDFVPRLPRQAVSTPVAPALPGQRRPEPARPAAPAPRREPEPATETRPKEAPAEEPGGSPRTGPRESPVLAAHDAAAVAPLMLVDVVFGAVAVVVTTAVLLRTGLYRRRFSLGLLDDVPQVALAGVAGTVAGLGAALLLGTSPAWWLGGVLVATLLLGRGIAYRRLKADRTTGRRAVNVLIVCHESDKLAERVENNPHLGARVPAVSKDGRWVVDREDDRKYRIEEALERFDLHDVIACGAVAEAGELSSLERLWQSCPNVHVLAPRVGLAPRRGWDDHLWGIPLTHMRRHARLRRVRVVKRALDVTLAGGALLALAPLLGVVAALVRWEVGPGVIFRQQRVGVGGRRFDVLKFRSMRQPSTVDEDGWGTASSADRIGPVGRVIRKYSIDELPQLWNVLRGDMSIVGPRPERPEYVEEFSQTYAHYGARHRAPVGLTGWAAVEGLRGDTSIEDRAHFDNFYIDSWSLWLDVKIILRTMLCVVRGTGA